MTSGVRLENCGKTFPDGTRALDPITLEVEQGETVVLLGPSGCGKTTTLRIIAGLEQPDLGGRVLFAGEDVTATPIERRNVGMVFQSYALFPNMSVAENIGYGLKIRRVGGAERRARIAELVALTASRALSIGVLISSRAASGNAWRWRALSLSARASCFWTSRSLRSTRHYASGCAAS